jgi:hypothetical protein
MSGLCKYANILGEPNTGVHSIRLFDIAVVDVILTILLGYIISIVFKANIILSIIFSFLLGIIVHRIFCVNSTINKLIFGQK